MAKSSSKPEALWRSLSAIVADYVPQHPWRFLIALLLLLLAGLAESVGVLSLLPLLEILLFRGNARFDNPVMQVFLQAYAAVGLELNLTTVLAGMLAAILVKAVLQFVSEAYFGIVFIQITRNLRLRLLRATSAAKWAYFTREPAGRLLNAFTTESQSSTDAAKQLFGLANFTIQTLVYFATALLISWEFTALALVSGIFLLVSLNKLISVSRRHGRRRTELMRTFSSGVIDWLHGLKSLKAMHLEGLLARRLAENVEGICRAQTRIQLYGSIIKALQEPFGIVFLMGGLILAVEVLDVPPAALLILAGIFLRTIGRISGIQSALVNIAILESTHHQLEATIRAAEAADEALESTTHGRQPHLQSELRVEELSFSYIPGTPVLENLSLNVPVGSLVAVVGTSGAGKSTLLDLLSGLSRTETGRIMVDGKPLWDHDIAAWRRSIGYVPQEAALLHDTIRNNLTLGGEFSETDIQTALERAGAAEFVAAQANGLETMVGERGASLSGGQRQRLSIARALLRKPILLLLDEATSAMDAETERDFCATLAKLIPDITVIAITHRPAIERIASIAYRLENGRLTERAGMLPYLPSSDRNIQTA
ncbi:MAG: ABC transporter ATP-binding protein/permease [Ferrovibrio sp.]|uniref:ABC transporter ATP-binding protein n=1 Tax=Ferrovibrio sp. TaxID=1917215 RepID=UPI0026039F72|nr:ABC transporter ATP-binding protein [Ferrovibrio sp.]MCW0234924.1 ABC transporter ATP-binding protein/permease [Ferrovibrio sp.]